MKKPVIVIILVIACCLFLSACKKKVGEGTPTSKESVQDVPSASKYTKVDILYKDNVSSIFIYEEDSKWYIEQPYKGIYEVDETLFSLLKAKD